MNIFFKFIITCNLVKKVKNIFLKVIYKLKLKLLLIILNH